jgi:hypothetical protein
VESGREGPPYVAKLFLKSLLGTIAAGFHQHNKVFAARPSRILIIQESPVAEFQYHAGERVWGELRVGDARTRARVAECLR